MNRKLIIYLDTCCYSRLFDVTDQIDVIEEVGRIRHIIRNRFSGKYIIVGSGTVTAEISRNPDNKERRITERLYTRIKSDETQLTAQIILRAQRLQLKGLKEMDSFHLAAAEAMNADYLLTVDKYFIKKCSMPNFTAVAVINPINF